MRIYFSAPIRASRERAHDYLQMIELCKKYGEVLTEHIGDSKIIPSSDIGLSEPAIYKRDMEMLGLSDIIIADVSIPSLGVGYELSKAEDMEKPTLCLYRREEGKRLSAMIKGSPKLTVKEYESVSEACSLIESFLKGNGA